MRTSYFVVRVVPVMVMALAGCEKTNGDAPSGPRASAAQDAGPGAADVAQAKAKFETTVRPILVEHCASCHAANIRPLHSSPNVDTAYQEIMTFHLVDFQTPKNSRLYTRLAVDNHYCWNGSCASSSQTMLDALVAWSAAGAPSADAQGPARHDGPPTAIPDSISQGGSGDAKLNDGATELSFTMATPSQGPVVFSIRVEKFDKYSYRLFWPTVRAPIGVTVTAKGLLLNVNDSLLPDGSFSLLDKSVEGKGTDAVVLDATTTMILLMDKGPGADRIAPSFAAFEVK